MDPVTIGILSIAGIAILILMGLHIGVALATVSVIGVYAITGRERVAANLLSSTGFNAVNDYVFAVVPLFVAMGMFATASGAVRDLFAAADALTRRIRGGVGISTVWANAVFAAVTGVSVASAAVFSKIAMPEMERLGYHRRFGLGIIASSALLGMLIPPSVLMIIYAVTVELSIGRLFAAGVLPGLLVALVLSLSIWGRALFNPSLVGIEATGNVAREPPLPLGQTLLLVWPIVLLIGLVLGGIYGGIFTPIEAGAVGAFGAFMLVLARRRLTGKGLWLILQETGAATASIFFLLMAAQMYSRMLTLSRLPDALSIWVTGLNIPPIAVIFAFIVVLLILGCLIDSASIILLTAPIMAPIAVKLGYDPVWFGIVAIVTIELGLLTPPFGMVVFAMKASLPPDVTLEDIFVGAMPFFALLLIALGLLIAFPEIILWLPRVIFG